MFRPIRSKHILVLFGVLCVSPGLALAADSPEWLEQLPVLVPDSFDMATIESDAWAQPLQVRVVSLSDVPVLAGVDAARRDPNLPARIATTIIHPDTLEPIEINIVEVGWADDQFATELLINTDLPFTREVELEATLAGVNVRQPRGSVEPLVDPECWVSGVPVVELHVWYAPGLSRSQQPNYGVQIVVAHPTSGKGNGDPKGGGEYGGDPGGNPDPPLFKPDGRGGDGTDGGDPGGNPDPPLDTPKPD